VADARTGTDGIVATTSLTAQTGPVGEHDLLAHQSGGIQI
jgi:hypothetical protein